ncbi:MAG: hypothetical protein V1806_08605 [Pseudomonadota bacterium]
MTPAACPLPRWPQISALLERRGWRVHHLARMLDTRPSQLFAYLYGRQEMPRHLRRRAERLLDLTPGGLG